MKMSKPLADVQCHPATPAAASHILWPRKRQLRAAPTATSYADPCWASAVVGRKPSSRQDREPFTSELLQLQSARQAAIGVHLPPIPAQSPRGVGGKALPQVPARQVLLQSDGSEAGCSSR